MSIITSEADFLREVIAEALTAPIERIGTKNAHTPRAMWPTTQAIVIGGFAVHENTSGNSGGWTVTHVATGLSGGSYADMWRALIVAGIYLGSGAPWHEVKSEKDVNQLVGKDARQRIKAAIERLPLTVDFVGEVAPEGKPADD